MSEFWNEDVRLFVRKLLFRSDSKIIIQNDKINMSEFKIRSEYVWQKEEQ